MSVQVRCRICGAEGELPEARATYFCLGCRSVVTIGEQPRPQRGRRPLWVVLPLLLALTVPGARAICTKPTPFSAERATMAYIATLTSSWERRLPSEFTGVATSEHTAGLRHPGMPARAIFSPYLQQARFDRIETACRRATVDLMVWTGFKPTFIVPREVTLELTLEDGRLKVTKVIGR